MVRAVSSVQSKTKSLTPFRLRSNHEGLKALCQQAGVSILSDPQPTAVTDHHRPAAESVSTSPQIGRRIVDQRPNYGQTISSKTIAETCTMSSASLDARPRLQPAVGSRLCGPRTLSASLLSSDASLDSVEHRQAADTAAGQDADLSSTVDSDATAASELRRRRRAELVRARTAGERSEITDNGTSLKPGDDGVESRTTGDRLSYHAPSTSSLRPGISTSSSTSTPSLHMPAKTPSSVDGEFPVAAQQQTRPHESFQQIHSKTPWRSVRSASDMTSDAVPLRSSLLEITSGQGQPVSSTTCVPATLIQSSSSGLMPSRSPSTTRVELLKQDSKPETRLKSSSVYGSTSAIRSSKTEPAANPGDVTSSVAGEMSRTKPRITIYSSDARDRDTHGASTGASHDTVQTKDRFNELLGKALESAIPADGHQPHQTHHELLTEPLPHCDTSEVVDPHVREKSAASLLTINDIDSEPSTTQPMDTVNGQSLPRISNKETTAMASATTQKSVGSDSVKTAVDKESDLTSRKTASGKQQRSKQYVSDSTAIVSVTTQSHADISSGVISSSISQTKSTEQLRETGFRRQATLRGSEVGMVSSQGSGEAQVDNVLYITDVGRLQDLGRSDAKAGVTDSRNIHPLHSVEVSGAIETRAPSLAQHHNLSHMDSEPTLSRAHGSRTLSESLPSLLQRPSPLKESPSLNTAVTNKLNADTVSSQQTDLRLSVADNTRFMYPAVDGDQCRRSESVEILYDTAGASEKLGNSVPLMLPSNLGKPHLQRHSEKRLNKAHTIGSRAVQPDVEETHIVHVVNIGSADAKSHSSVLKGGEAALADASDKIASVHKTVSELGLQETHLPNVHQIENIAKRSHVETLPSASSMDTSDIRPRESYVSNAARQELVLNDRLNCSDVYGAMESLDTSLKQPSRHPDNNSLSVDIKPSTVVLPRQLYHADISSDQPCFVEKVDKICRLQRQTAVVQESEVNQEPFQFCDIQNERVKPINVESVFHTADDRRVLKRSVCHFHVAVQTLVTGDSDECRQSHTTEQIGPVACLPQSDRVEPRTVGYSVDDGRLLTKTGCNSHARAMTLAASETVDGRKLYINPSEEKIKYMESFPTLHQVKPQNIDSAFHFVDASAHLRKTNCHYRTKLLTALPTYKSVIAQTGRSRKSTVEQPKETIGNLEGIKPESATSTIVEDATVRRWRELVKVHPVPQIRTMASRLVGNKLKSSDNFSPFTLGQKTDQKGASVSGKDEAQSPRSNAETFPLIQRPVETASILNRNIQKTDSTQSSTITIPPVTPSDASLSTFHHARKSFDVEAKSNGKTPVAITNLPSVGGQGCLVSAVDSSTRVGTFPRHNDNMQRTSSQDKASVYQSSVSDRIQLQKSEMLSKTVNFVTSVPQPQATNISSISSTISSSSGNQTPELTGSSVSSQEEKTISLSTNVRSVTSAEASDRAGVEQYQVKFPDDGNFAVKRDLVAKKARNILKSREDFLALQTQTPASTDVSGTIEGGVGVRSSQLEQFSTPLKMTEPVKKDVTSSSMSESRPAKMVKIALREDDVADDYQNVEGQQVASADTAKAAFPPLVSGRSWDAIVKSSSVDEPASPGGPDRRPTEPRQNVVASRVTFAASRADTTAGVPDTGRASRPILRMAKSFDAEQSTSGTVNIDPQLAAVLRMRKEREETLEREEAVLKSEETGNSQYAEYRYGNIEILVYILHM